MEEHQISQTAVTEQVLQRLGLLEAAVSALLIHNPARLIEMQQLLGKMATDFKAGGMSVPQVSLHTMIQGIETSHLQGR